MASNNTIRPATGLIALLVFAALFTSAVALLHSTTKNRIANNQAAYAGRMILDVLPDGGFDNQPQTDVYLIDDASFAGAAGELPIYRARLGNSPVAAAMTAVAADGYVDPIRLLIGIDSKGQIIHVRVIEHRETPGLGDQIDIRKSGWISQFDGKRLDTFNNPNAWRVKKDGGEIDQITGATITSRAVSRTVRRSLEYFEANQAELLAPTDE